MFNTETEKWFLKAEKKPRKLVFTRVKRHGMRRGPDRYGASHLRLWGAPLNGQDGNPTIREMWRNLLVKVKKDLSTPEVGTPEKVKEWEQRQRSTEECPPSPAPRSNEERFESDESEQVEQV